MCKENVQEFKMQETYLTIFLERLKILFYGVQSYAFVGRC